MWLLEIWKICEHCDMGQAICMYSTLAVSASCNIFIYKGISKLFTGASVQLLLQIFVQVCPCTLFCKCAVTCSTGRYRNVLMSTENWLEMQALSCLLTVQFRAIRFFTAIVTLDMQIYDNLTNLSAKLKGKVSCCIQVTTV